MDSSVSFGYLGSHEASIGLKFGTHEYMVVRGVVLLPNPIYQCVSGPRSPCQPKCWEGLERAEKKWKKEAQNTHRAALI